MARMIFCQTPSLWIPWRVHKTSTKPQDLKMMMTSRRRMSSLSSLVSSSTIENKDKVNLRIRKLKKGWVSESFPVVPNHIPKPSYFFQQQQQQQQHQHQQTQSSLFAYLEKAPIPILSTADIVGIRNASKLARKALNFAGTLVKPGVRLDEIDQQVHNKIIEWGGYPSPLYYFGFPRSICTSLNECMCHGIPDDTDLKDGDILKIDVTVYYEGYHGDCCDSFLVGIHPDHVAHRRALQFLQVAKECLHSAISICSPGIPFNHIGAHIQKFLAQHGHGTPRFCSGHGIGRDFHTAPLIYHTENNYPGKMAPGMAFTIEPIVVFEGDPENAGIWEDGWTIVSLHGSVSAQFEHTVLITKSGVEILTAD